MQPPRERAPRIDFGNIEIVRAILVNATALVTTLLLLRFATLLIPGSDDATIPGFIQLATEPIIWPFTFIPPLGMALINEARLADLLLIPVIAFIGVFVTGVVTGWRDPSNSPERHPALRE